MWFEVLGPLRVHDGDRQVRLGGVRRTATLCYLLLYSNEMVPVSRLMDAVWPAAAPPSGKQVLHNAVFRLRTALAGAPGADPPLLLRRGPGYLLSVDDDRVDLARFRTLSEQGRAELSAGLWERASATLSAALDCWRGPALADLVEHGYDWPEMRALRDARTAAVEHRVEADMAMRRYRDVIGDLAALVEAEPLRERACGNLMLALYRCGRRSDALGVYRRTRAALVEGLGLEPSPPLRELERAILDREPGPDAALAPAGTRGGR
ncbi:AfsR/SARP family transcriptional regulator [Saccharothrix sp. Mg75]|uniref:AfsR/SARP family transcriptional regulator n=1 Tax=Saccharothrix sp. Mg75 TaxID=3445357 RepID=UPI003EE87F04